jgi:hypothetical protein
MLYAGAITDWLRIFILKAAKVGIIVELGYQHFKEVRTKKREIWRSPPIMLDKLLSSKIFAP